MNQEKILIAPLNWGLGHATRCVPLINKFLEEDKQVILGAHGAAYDFLKKEYPNLTCLKIKQMHISYAKGWCFYPWLALQMPFFLSSVMIEKRRLSALINRYKITKVISDNRYGLYSKNTRNIIITHQLYPKLPAILKGFERLTAWLIKKLISRFDECWVPDYPEFEKSLSGSLSHRKNQPANIKFIGPLSRFSNAEPGIYSEKTAPHTLVLISGPEPYRTRFEKEMEGRFSNANYPVLMLCGKPGKHTDSHPTINCTGLIKLNHLSSNLLQEYMLRAENIIARSGYSTIMDLHALNKKAELNPTPQQSEQLYLHHWLKKRNIICK